MSTVLVVDDKPSQTEVMCILIGQLGLDCLAAHSGIEAVQSAKQFQPDIILMDWVMPSETWTGMDAVQQLISDPSTQHIPIIAFSAVADLSSAIQIGCADYFNKPFGKDILLQKLRPFI